MITKQVPIKQTLTGDVEKQIFAAGDVYTIGKSEHKALLTGPGPNRQMYLVFFFVTRDDYAMGRVENTITREFREYAQAEAYCIAWVDRPVKDQGLAIWDNGGETADRYTVCIGRDIYGMSDDADQPNGVCMYITRGEYTGRSGEKAIEKLNALPKRVQRQIAYLCYRDWQFGN